MNEIGQGRSATDIGLGREALLDRKRGVFWSGELATGGWEPPGASCVAELAQRVIDPILSVLGRGGRANKRIKGVL